MKSGCPNAQFSQEQRRWCSTRTNPATGIHVSGQNEYGFCNSDCPDHDSGLFESQNLFFEDHVFIFNEKSYVFQI